MKFSEFRRKHTEKRKPKMIPYPVFTGGEKQEVEIGLRYLGGGESTDILAEAETFARKGGSENPKAGDPLYEMGIRVHTLLRACVDPEVEDSESRSARFFSCVDEVLERGDFAKEEPIIGRDGIAFLFESHEAWQDHCGPQEANLTEAEFWPAVLEVASSDDPLGFVRLRPGVQWSLARFMAKQLLMFQTLKRPSGSSSTESSSTAAKSQTGKNKTKRTSK